MKPLTQIAKAKVNDLIHASWNYKTDGTEEQIQKLMAAIAKQGSCGVLMVREIEVDGKNVFEVMDGNHRLTALRRLGWEECPIENFGKISQADAIVYTRQRNEQWFEDDKLKLAVLFSNEVFADYTPEYLSTILPDTLEQLHSYKALANVEWVPPNLDGENDNGDAPPDEDKYKLVKLWVTEEVFNLWEKWLERAREITGLESDARAFEFAVIEALNVPEEQLAEGLADE